jgi:RNA polymerase sigma-70 factor (ECF subfamily)
VLAELFLTHAPAGRPAEPQLGQVLDALLGRARAAFPEVQLDAAAFVEWLAPRAGGELAVLPVEELFLAWACARGDAAATRALDRLYLARLAPAVGRVDPSPEFLDEVLQQLREKLLVGPSPRIATYDGAGPLMSWLRAAAVRTALNARRPGAREVAADDEALEALPLSGPDPELAAVRGQHRAVFSEAFQAALATLTPRERNLLRLQALDGLSLGVIGEMYGVNKSTVSRWLARAHEGLLAATREGLARRLALDDAALESLLRAMRSSLELSVARLLGPAEP